VLRSSFFQTRRERAKIQPEVDTAAR